VSVGVSVGGGAFEVALGVRVDWVLHVGDFGVGPDPARVDGNAQVAGVPCVGLNKGHYPGCLVAFETKPGELAWPVLGECLPKASRE
jgi:hypothetical protein